MLVSAAQASAQAEPNLDRAFEGVGLGLAAASEIAGSDVIVVDESLIKAFDAWDKWVEKHPEFEAQGQGPSHADQVHAWLSKGLIPGQMDKDTGSKLSKLDGAYGKLKSQSDEAKKIKEDKDNQDKEDKVKEDKSQNDKSKSEASSGSASDESRRDDIKSSDSGDEDGTSSQPKGKDD